MANELTHWVVLAVATGFLILGCSRPSAPADGGVEDSLPVDSTQIDSNPDSSSEGSSSSEDSSSEDAGTVQPFGQSGGWHLVFSDEFEGTELDVTKWVTCFPWGFPEGCGSTTTPQMWYLPQNVLVEDGMLRLRATNTPVTANGRTYPYTSGMITTSRYYGESENRYIFSFGFIEIRARIPAGQGLWPAFWTLLPDFETWPPEIDVMEILGHETNICHMHYHYEDSDGAHQDSPGTYEGPDYAADFHVFAVDWSTESIRWFIDGTQRRPPFAQRDYIVSEPMYLVLNLQVGGEWPGPPDSTTSFPSYFDIDYIRVWQSASGLLSSSENNGLRRWEFRNP